MSKRRVVILFTGIGIAVPALWFFVYWSFLKGNPSLVSSVMGTFHLDRILLAIWPSWIFLVADPEEQSVVIPVASVVVNAVLYGVLGWLVWFGLYRHKAILGAAIAAILVAWYFLLNWYTGG